MPKEFSRSSRVAEQVQRELAELIRLELKDPRIGLVTITGGKATTCRAMAEKTADTVCRNLGLSIGCQTKDVVLESYRAFYRYNQESRP